MGKEHRGFATMDRDKQREIASKGGKAAHDLSLRTNPKSDKMAHEWTLEEASEAGRKGGEATRDNRREKAAQELKPLFQVQAEK